MFPHFRSPNDCIIIFIVSLWCLSSSVRGFILFFFDIPSLNQVFCYSAKAIGPMGQLSFLASGFAVVEMLAIRFHVARQYYTSFNSVPDFYHLLNLTNDRLMKRVVFIAKMSNGLTASLAALLFVTLVVLSSFQLTWGLFLAPFWYFATLAGPFFASSEVNTMAYITNLNFRVIKESGEQLVHKVTRMSTHNEFNDRSIQLIVSEYKSVLELIHMFAATSKVMMLLAHLLCIPTYAIVLYAFSIPVESSQVYLKAVMMVTASSYNLRGYILVSHLAGMHDQSRRLHCALASLSARARMKPSEKQMLLCILEDITSSRNHWAIPEFAGNKVTRQDSVWSILITVQLCLLGYEFKNLFR